MPNETSRRKSIKSLRAQIYRDKAEELLETSTEEDSSSSSESAPSDTEEESSDSDSEEGKLSSLFILACVEEMRYLSQRLPLVKSKEFLRLVVPALDERRFRQLARMSRDHFDRLVQLIGQNPVFLNKSRHRQNLPSLQILVAVYRFGRYGNACTKYEVGQKFGISEGTVELSTRRTIVALLSVESTLVKWPSEDEKNLIKSRISEEHGFPHCIGMVDGTNIVLDIKPAACAEDYFTRKRNYGLSAMIICDDLRRIIYAHCGFTGSTHDNRVYENSKPGLNSAKYFAEEEYLVADSAYAVISTVIPAYKKPAANLEEIKKFNTRLASLRISVEICIGMLKGRFQSLRGLRILIKDAKDHARAVYWFRACCVLHNFLLDDFYDESWTEKELELEEILAEENTPYGATEQTKGKLKRDSIRNIVKFFKKPQKYY